jgi:hypothetical protein
MTKKTFITMMLVLIAIAGWAQEEHIDTVIPKFLSNGYFFREMPTLPDGEKTMSRLKDKKGIVRHAVHGLPFPSTSGKSISAFASSSISSTSFRPTTT